SMALGAPKRLNSFRTSKPHDMKIFSWKPDLVTLFPSHYFGAIGDRVQSAACVKRTGKREHLWPFAEIEQAIQAKSLRLLGGKRQLVPAHVKRRFGDVGR